uniref:Uncharacterized protein AlNc14C139G7213 n=1 Tax=Albugo laibachii Nc14 TaxID=890382 RepID=F0WL26_9STRA|nr:conserved hypothetical protein [Albugo laibachii Nc14]|eukprot:CCA21985.1 conserved hypothetical protein [Albugo laibachii Nc14]
MHGESEYEFRELKDEVKVVVQKAVLKVMEGQKYDHITANDCIQNVLKVCVDELKRLSTNFKFIVTCHIQQRKGAALDSHSSSYWDEETDGSCVITWESSSLMAILYVYGLAL